MDNLNARVNNVTAELRNMKARAPQSPKSLANIRATKANWSGTVTGYETLTLSITFEPSLQGANPAFTVLQFDYSCNPDRYDLHLRTMRERYGQDVVLPADHGVFNEAHFSLTQRAVESNKIIWVLECPNNLEWENHTISLDFTAYSFFSGVLTVERLSS